MKKNLVLLLTICLFLSNGIFVYGNESDFRGNAVDDIINSFNQEIAKTDDVNEITE